ncbi:MAG: sulfite exporter TauE/SafE family protein [Nanoarchaeota archaeon]|nr:sulfite exporter TauE/SafE family protein [Nanoarchaeota archaeon]MBU1030037.1 sulfite exporter TauE/SafE family protein [Nanoarchaeota archaeon]
MIEKKGFIAKGTTCDGCATIIKKQALKVNGVNKVSFDLSTETGYVVFDKKKTDIDEILSKIEEKNYTCSILNEQKQNTNKTFGWISAIIGLIIVGYFLFNFVDGIQLPSISQNMSFGLLFVVGLLTGFHCISMCGGFVISYAAKHAQEGTKSHKSHLMYGIGKTTSYTIIGAIFGLLGSFIAFTPTIRGVIGFLAGLFLVLYGLKMLNIFPILRKIQLRTPKFITNFVGKNSKYSSPLTIGLLNGLMIACGPLQAIYIMAAGTGSMIGGAKLLLVFGLGTLPVMLGFGYFASFVSGKVTQKILKASGVIVIILGLVMINNSLVLTGTGYDFSSISGFVTATGTKEMAVGSVLAVSDGFQEIRMEVNRNGWNPDTFVLKKGVPVRWIINGKEITGCNNAIQVPKYGLEFNIKSGEQIVEFTPDEEGVVRWSCWMGMIPGTFIVINDVNLSDQEAVQKEINQVPQQPKGSCGGSCGSPVCEATRGGSCGCGS